MRNIRISLLLAGLLCASAWAGPDSIDLQRLHHIQQRWAEIQYQLPSEQRSAAFSQLSNEAEDWTHEHPSSAESWIWLGIVTSSWAGAEGGLGGLGKAKTAKADFEHALELDPQALQGSAYTSLAALYDRVPGWPIGFGNSNRAAELLQQALAINPDGIDTLYFWADHLYRQRDYRQAQSVLRQALQAKPRPERASADAGRRQEIETLLAEVQQKLK